MEAVLARQRQEEVPSQLLPLRSGRRDSMSPMLKQPGWSETNAGGSGLPADLKVASIAKALLARFGTRQRESTHSCTTLTLVGRNGRGDKR